MQPKITVSWNIYCSMFVLCRCSSAEEKLNIAEGVLKRIVKTQEQKEKDLEAVIH